MHRPLPLSGQKLMLSNLFSTWKRRYMLDGNVLTAFFFSSTTNHNIWNQSAVICWKDAATFSSCDLPTELDSTPLMTKEGVYLLPLIPLWCWPSSTRHGGAAIAELWMLLYDMLTEARAKGAALKKLFKSKMATVLFDASRDFKWRIFAS